MKTPSTKTLLQKILKSFADSKVSFISIFVLLILISNTYAQQTSQVSPWGTKFLLYIPPSYVLGTPSPVLLYLHGGGSIGNDLTILTKSTSSDKGPPWLIANNKWPSSRPLIVISPQLKRNTLITNKNNQEWPMDSVNEVIEYVRSQYTIDANRLYLTGMSFGGAGCWTYATTYPNKVAAVVPLSGKTDLTKACIVKDIPLWVFHGANDPLVFTSHSVNMVNAINACQPTGIYKPKLTLLNARVHEGWNEVWDGTNGYFVFDWLLQFTKNNVANKPPTVTAGADIRILLRTGSLHLTGEYFDSDGTISTVNWTQISGSPLTLTGNNSNLLKLTNLIAGTFEFELRVTDNSGAQSYDRVIIEIVSSVPALEVAVTDLVLINGSTNIDIGNLSEGMVINKTTLGTTQFNVRAITNSALAITKSVRFRVNTDQNARTASTPFLIRKQTISAEWTMADGEYNICVTPFKSTSAKGNPGITQCYKVSVVTQVAAAKTETISANLRDENQIDPNISSYPIENNSIKIYPNPASGYLHVQGIELKNKTAVAYTIISMLGQEMQQGKLSAEEFQYGTDIILTTSIQQGVHFIILANQEINHRLKFTVK